MPNGKESISKNPHIAPKNAPCSGVSGNLKKADFAKLALFLHLKVPWHAQSHDIGAVCANREGDKK